MCGPCGPSGYNACGKACTCVPDGSCSAEVVAGAIECVDNCGNPCTGGSCPVCHGCDASCVDTCSNPCTGGLCGVCIPDGSCSSACVDNCGNSCTGGSCCSGACDYATCLDGCGDPCC